MMKEISVKDEKEQIGTGRLNELLPNSMKKEIRKHVLNGGLATIEQLAVMTDIDVFRLFSENYSFIFHEASKIELVEKNN